MNDMDDVKAFNVFYSTGGKSSSTTLIIIGSETIQDVLAMKDKNFEVGDSYSKINHYREIPFSNVMLKDLSIHELFKITKFHVKNTLENT